MSATLDEEKAAEERQEASKLAASLHSGDQEALAHHATNLSDGANLTPEHRDYLIKRHGTVSLDPLPSADPADPLNWPSWKVSFSNFGTKEETDG